MKHVDKFSLYKNDVTFGTGPAVMSMHRYTVIRSIVVRIDRQGNRSASISKVVEGIGCIYEIEFDYITFSTLQRFLYLTYSHDFYAIPGTETVTLVVQSEKYQ